MSEVGALVVLAAASAGHALLWVGIVNRLHGWAGPRNLIDVLTWGCFLLLPGVPLLLAAAWWEAPGSGANAWWATLSGTAQAYVWASVALGVVGCAAKLLWVEPTRYDRRVLVEWDAELEDQPFGRELPAAGPLARGLARVPLNEAWMLSVDRKTLRVPALPSVLEGLRMVHLSDLHMTGRLARPFYEAVVRRTNQERPDVICLTGDLLENEDCWPWLTEILGRLKARLGVFYILGNHDKYVDMAETHRLLRDVGWVSLSDGWQQRTWEGATVWLGGNELPWLSMAADLAEVDRTDGGRLGRSASPGEVVDERLFRVVLCHSPDQFGWCCRAGAHLVLAGHTHGGQIQVPGVGPLVSPSLHGTRFACGVFLRGSTAMHVTRGGGWQDATSLALSS